MPVPAKRKCPHCGLLLSKHQVNQHLECRRLLLASAHNNSWSSGSGSDSDVNGTISEENDAVSVTFDMPLPDLSPASPDPITSASLIPEWFEPYLGNNADSDTDEGHQHHEMLNPVTLDITDSTNEVAKLLANLHDLELDEDTWTLCSVCKWVNL